MSFSVAFLGHHYELPDEILDYLEYERVTSRIMGSVLDLMIDKVEECKLGDAHSLVEELRKTRKPYQRLMISTAEEYVKELIAKGIFDISSIELLERTDGFEKLDNLADDALDKHLEEAKRIFSDQLDDMQRAYSSAESSITGSGVSVYTSSALTLMASGVFETGVLRSQAKKADREFSEACASIEARANSAEARNDAHTIFGIFLPALSELMLECCQGFYGVFLSEMAARGLFDFDSMRDYDLSKAERTLDNITLVPDPKKLLQNCFETCPYCARTFEVAFNMNLMDVGAYEAARLMGLTQNIDEGIKQKCIELSDDRDLFDTYIQIFMSSESLDRRAALRSVFVTQMDALIKSVCAILDAPQSDCAMGKWLSTVDALSDASVLVRMDTNQIGAAVRNHIDSLSSEKLRCRMDGLDFSEMMALAHHPCPEPFEAICSDAVSSLPKRVFDYGKRLEPYVARCESCADRLTEISDTRKQSCGILEACERSTLAFFEQQRSALGLFDSEIRAEMDEIEECMSVAFERYEERCAIEAIRSKAKSARKEARSTDCKHLDLPPQDELPIEREMRRLINAEPSRKEVDAIIQRRDVLKR